MFTLTDRSSLGRRAFLQIGALPLAGALLPGLLARAARAGLAPRLADRSVIFLFLHGGPSQTETFDPKMTAPAGVRSVTGEVATSLPGVTFGGTFPQLAQRADRLVIVRSFQAGDSNHNIKPIVARETLDANVGSLYARLAGPTNPQTGIPRNVALFPRSVDPSTQPANNNFGQFTSTGTLGSAYAPFVPGGDGPLQSAMQLSMPLARLSDRRRLLAQLDHGRRQRDRGGIWATADELQQQAFDTILGGVADAFDLRREDPQVVQQYDTGRLVRPDQISRRWRNYDNYVDNAKALGKLLLLARRLCEAGCGFITVTTNFVWDMHADVNNAGVEEGMQYMGLPLDHALSVFLDDVERRGLREKILLVVCGEMGRTPKVNAQGGRDHWGRLAPLLLYGGGLPAGQVVGASTRDASEPATTPVTIGHLTATVLGQLLDIGQLRTLSGVPDDLLRVATHDPIPGLV